MINGVINIYKEKGFTSHDVVAKMRGILKQKKIGHTGTLDPDACGVLPVCIGNATKLCDMLTEHDKEYIAVMQLGVMTDTQDLSGTVLATNGVTVSEEEIRDIVASFLGEGEQIPPMYSAIKVDGKKLYELARSGIEVERAPRKVTFYEIEILSVRLPELTMRVKCSKGTYIRTLCHDIGQKAGCGGAMKELERIRSGRFDKSTAVTLAELERLRDEDALEKVLLPTDAVFADYTAVHVPEPFMKAVKNGNLFPLSHIRERLMLSDGEKVRVYDTEETFYGVYAYREKEGLLRPYKMFL